MDRVYGRCLRFPLQARIGSIIIIIFTYQSVIKTSILLLIFNSAICHELGGVDL